MESYFNTFFVVLPQPVVLSEKKNKKVCVWWGGAEHSGILYVKNTYYIIVTGSHGQP